MAFSKITTADDWIDLMTQIKTFATANGWTTSYDDIAGVGGLGPQLGLNCDVGNCAFAIGTKNSTENEIQQTDAYNLGTVDDARLYMSVNHSLDGSGNKKWWGHPNGADNNNIVTAALGMDESGQGIVVNDLAGDAEGTGQGNPFDAVYFFSDTAERYVWVVVQTEGDRFTVFGFGNLDKKDMGHDDTGFCVGLKYEWWPDGATISAGDWVDVRSTAHRVGLFGEQTNNPVANAMLFLKDDTVDDSLGYTSGDYQTRALWVTKVRRSDNGSSKDRGSGSPEPSGILDYFATIDNQTTTGGAPLSALPVLVRQNGHNTFVGEFPDIRLVSMQGFIPAQEIEYGSETWMVFPLKRQGSKENLEDGTNPLPFVNSSNYGFAIKKTT